MHQLHDYYLFVTYKADVNDFNIVVHILYIFFVKNKMKALYHNETLF